MSDNGNALRAAAVKAERFADQAKRVTVITRTMSTHLRGMADELNATIGGDTNNFSNRGISLLNEVGQHEEYMARATEQMARIAASLAERLRVSARREDDASAAR
jgi:hypothetical protein